MSEYCKQCKEYADQIATLTQQLAVYEETCPVCNGEGTCIVSQGSPPEDSNTVFTTTGMCSHCKGTGYSRIDKSSWKCDVCPVKKKSVTESLPPLTNPAHPQFDIVLGIKTALETTVHNLKQLESDGIFDLEQIQEVRFHAELADKLYTEMINEVKL